MRCCIGGVPSPPTSPCVSSTCVSSTCVSSTCVSSTSVLYTRVSSNHGSPVGVSSTCVSSTCVLSIHGSPARASHAFISPQIIPRISQRVSPTLTLSISLLLPNHETISTMQLSHLIQYISAPAYTPLQYDTFDTIKNLT